MAAITYTGVQYRTVTSEHLAAEVPSKSMLMASGAVRIDPAPPFKNGGGVVYNVPHWLELTQADEAPAAATDSTVYPLSTFKDVGIIVHRQLVVGRDDISQYIVGQDTDINAAISAAFTAYWPKRLDIALYNVLKGAFATAMSSETYFVYQAGTTFTRTALLGAARLDSVGDQWEKYRILIMHSKQFFQAVNEGLVTYVNAGAYGERLLATGDIPTILGKQVIVDDNIVENDGTVYMLQPGAMYLGFQRDLGIEYERKATLASGTDTWVGRVGFMPHLYGLTSGLTSPLSTNTNLSTGSNWSLSQTTDYKLFKAVKMVFVNT